MHTPSACGGVIDLSEGEAIMLARRVKIAELLLAGKSYDEIMDTIGAGRGTVAKVHHWLHRGFGGYEATVTRFNNVVAKRKKDITSKRAEPFSYAWMKRKYPLQFVLFNLFEEATKGKK